MAAALARAEALCGAHGARLTPLRRRVLAIVWRRHAPIGAYDILRALGAERAVTPATVYRALAFLRRHGLIHRIESLNAFVGCPRPGRRHAAQFLICRDCGGVGELDDAGLAAAIVARAAAIGFAPEFVTLEVRGRCARCAGDG